MRNSVFIAKFIKRMNLRLILIMVVHLLEDMSEFDTIICLQNFNLKRERTNHDIEEILAITGAMLFVVTQNPQSGSAINGRVLVMLPVIYPVRHVLDIHLHQLPRQLDKVFVFRFLVRVFPLFCQSISL